MILKQRRGKTVKIILTQWGCARNFNKHHLLLKQFIATICICNLTTKHRLLSKLTRNKRKEETMNNGSKYLNNVAFVLVSKVYSNAIVTYCISINLL